MVGERELRRFLIRVGHQPEKQEVKALMKRLDRDRDGQISVSEFYKAI